MKDLKFFFKELCYNLITLKQHLLSFGLKGSKPMKVSDKKNAKDFSNHIIDKIKKIRNFEISNTYN